MRISDAAGVTSRELGTEWTQAASGFDWQLAWECSQRWNSATDDFVRSPSFLAKLTGNESLGQALQENVWPMDFPAQWMDELLSFHAQRQAYLLYPLLRNQ